MVAFLAETDAGTEVEVTRKPLFCPHCGRPHVDEGEFATRLHHRHKCQSCLGEWVLDDYVFGVPSLSPVEVTWAEPRSPRSPTLARVVREVQEEVAKEQLVKGQNWG